MMETPSNSRTAFAAWRTFFSLLECNCAREGAHFVAVDPRKTTKEYASCGVSTEKPLWVVTIPVSLTGLRRTEMRTRRETSVFTVYKM
jgi:transposase